MRVLALAAALLVGAVLLPPGPLGAAEVIAPTGQTLTVEINEGRLIRIDAPASAVFLANPGIAEVSIKSPQMLYVFGKRAGETTLYVLDEDEEMLLNVTVSVTHNLSRLQRALNELVPGSGIGVQSVEGGIVLTGAVSSGLEAEDARRLAARFIGEGGEVINRIQVVAPNQVNLRVRIAEVSRSVLRQLGIDWNLNGDFGDFAFDASSRLFPFTEGAQLLRNAAGDTLGAGLSIGDFNLNSFLDALAQENLVSILAEPNLTALSGETASFLAGGEFPVPVAQDSDNGSATITVEFKKFGVSLAFTPTVLGSNRISMRVRPEVSSLSNQSVDGAVALETFTIPALITRQAETTVELASGQSFAIAGLIQNNARVDLEKVPGLGDIPILGELFRSDRFNRQETELVIVVTPYIVQPVSDRDLIALPTDATHGAPGTQRLAQTPSRTVQQPAGLAGPVGFVIE